MAELRWVRSQTFEEASDISRKSSIVRNMESMKRESGYINGGFNGITVPIQPLSIVVDIDNNSKMDDANLTSISIPISPLPPPPTSEAAVVVVNACKSYKAGGTQRPILHNLCMTVKQGTIYSLLGSSGCGKTTLLTCVVGMKHLDSGRILVFGSKTGTRESGVPGRRVGYMPQDSALYNDFSIKETITYFGSLYGMKSKAIETSRDFFVKLLSLPDETRRVGTLSGGQRRRVSLAVSLIHSPSLIILDEPTVGVDPLLRQSIWKHLLKLVSDGKTTVIITTHYIDEARYSDTVGVMRGGRLLTEKSPTSLFEEFKTNSLEEVVLKLCHDDETNSPINGRARSKSSGNIVKVEVERRYSHPIKKHSITGTGGVGFGFEETFAQSVKSSFTRIRSLTMKNIFVMGRNIFLVLFVILMPAMQIVVMGMSMGNDPKPIKVGVVNHEFNHSGGCNLEEFHTVKDECNIANLSCRYLSTLPRDTIHLMNYDTEDEAREDIKVGTIRSFLSFPKGYSDFLYERSTSGALVDNDTLEGSMLSFEMDASSAIVTKSLQRIAYESYKTFVQGLLSDCGFNPELGGLPVKFKNPIYGRYDMQLKEYVAAGMLVGVALFFPLCSSSITYIWDKKQGTMERARVAGANTWEIMMSYFNTEGTILVFQTCLSFLILTIGFQIPIVGSPLLAFLLVLLNGLAGISLGLLLASICSEEIQAILMGLAIIFPNFFLAGAIWPIEGMPIILQYLSYALPGTLACEAFRSIVVRGWGFSHLHVWTGFLSTAMWAGFYLFLNLFVHRITLAKK